MFFTKTKVKEMVTKEEMVIELNNWNSILEETNIKINNIKLDLESNISLDSKKMLEKSTQKINSDLKFINAHIFRIQKYINDFPNTKVSKNQFKMHSTDSWKK